MTVSHQPVRQIHVQLPDPSNPQQQRLAAIVRRQIESRCDARVGDGAGALTIQFELDANLKPESFEIRGNDEQSVVIAGGDQLGMLYGAGRFLRESRYTARGFVAGQWRGISEPMKPLRGMYLATHFHNFYHDAPVEKIVEYVEDVALWGINTIQVWYDMHHYLGIDDPKAREMIAHLRGILQGAKDVGLRICIIGLGNEAYANSPEELHADFNTGRANYKCELCPNKPGAMELLLQWYTEVLDAFADLLPDLIGFGPYDQGGCACEKCKPWGANGYLKVCEAKARIAKDRIPNVKILMSTWLFDYGKDQGEWQGLADAFKGGVDWCDYLQADSHETYPKFPLEKGVPGNLPLLNFPEISMWMMHPWGGFGANPLPRRFESLWQSVKHLVVGGFPYSEGIYEDINKALCAQFYWNPDRTAESILREYISFEYSPDVVDEVLEAIEILEANHNHIWEMNWEFKRQRRFPVFYKRDPKEAYAKLSNVDASLTPQARSAWRWRILYLRSLIDQELQPYEGYWANEVCEKAMHELTAIYYAQNAEIKCSPPTRDAVRRGQTSEYSVVG